jgi:hypothetical protein
MKNSSTEFSLPIAGKDIHRISACQDYDKLPAFGLDRHLSCKRRVVSDWKVKSVKFIIEMIFEKAEINHKPSI